MKLFLTAGCDSCPRQTKEDVELNSARNKTNTSRLLCTQTHTQPHIQTHDELNETGTHPIRCCCQRARMYMCMLLHDLAFESRIIPQTLGNLGKFLDYSVSTEIKIGFILLSNLPRVHLSLTVVKRLWTKHGFLWWAGARMEQRYKTVLNTAP